MPKKPTEKPLAYNAAELAERLRISRPTAYNLMHTENFPALRIGEKRLIVPAEALERWLLEQTANGKAVI